MPNAEAESPGLGAYKSVKAGPMYALEVVSGARDLFIGKEQRYKEQH